MPVRIDDKVATAHNKMMVIDGALVIGSNCNYMFSAEDRNAENVTFMRSECVAKMFATNFRQRRTVSVPTENQSNRISYFGFASTGGVPRI